MHGDVELAGFIWGRDIDQSLGIELVSTVGIRLAIDHASVTVAEMLEIITY